MLHGFGIYDRLGDIKTQLEKREQKAALAPRFWEAVMSLAELLPAIRALPKAERLQLLHLLVDGVAEVPPADDGIPEELRHLLPPPGTFIEYREPVTTDAAGWAVIEQMLAEINKQP